ncbi:uncharacterized protein BJX67DRAFT_371709 [Aspergillus lucknowensis]|uniref:Short-chain dehydrogenase n=1 Tax=Aspergillus lucknowensis TaxID=176173 RepID=A0ABR4LSX9_9EURO
MSRYAEAHKSPCGPGDARPTAMQIIRDENLEGEMKDKIFLVTGARAFATTRSLEKGQNACKAFLGPGRVELLQLDTSSLSSVRAAAATFLEKSSTLNVLICNAGVMHIPTREESPDGFEMQLATNYIGHFLLFWLLKDSMIKAAASSPTFASRLVNDINLKGEGVYTPMKVYGQSKLAQIYMANYVDRHYGSRGLHALSLMPGGIFTDLQRYVPKNITQRLRSNPDVLRIMKSAEQGAATTVFAAVAKEWEGRGGKYLEDCREAEPALGDVKWKGVREYVYDKSKDEKLWTRTLEMLGIKESK